MLLNPYHKLDDEEGICLIDIEHMRAHRIDQATSEILDAIEADPNPTLTPEIEDALNGLGLLPKRPVKSEREPKLRQAPITSIALFVTQKCNMRCVYCYGDGGGYGSEGTMDLTTARTAVDWLIDRSGSNKRIGISFFGGEPLLNLTLIKEIVNYADERAGDSGKTFSFSITTNGSLLDDATIAFLQAHAVHVNFSFDGVKEVQDAQRPLKTPASSYDTIVPKIERLLAALPHSAGRATVMADVDPLQAEQALRDLGFSQVAVEAASPSLFDTTAKTSDFALFFSRSQSAEDAEAQELLRRIRDRDTPGLKKLLLGSYRIVTRSLDAFINGRKKRFFCGAGRSAVAVSCTGGVYLCHRFVGMDAFRFGDIFGGELDRDLFQRSPLRSRDQCTGCFAKYVCAGWCYHDNQGIGGSIFASSDPRCRLMRHSVELLASLTSRLSPQDLDYLRKEGLVSRKPCPFDF